MLVALCGAAGHWPSADQPGQSSPRLLAARPTFPSPRACLPPFRSVNADQPNLVTAEVKAIAIDEPGLAGNPVHRDVYPAPRAQWPLLQPLQPGQRKDESQRR